MGLSPPVERAVDEAVSLILEVIAWETGAEAASGKGTS